jgi:hypothetical protein
MNQDVEDIEFDLWVNQNELFHSVLKAIRWAKQELSRMTTLSNQWVFQFDRYSDDKVVCKIYHPFLPSAYTGNPRTSGAEAVIDAAISLYCVINTSDYEPL